MLFCARTGKEKSNAKKKDVESRNRFRAGWLLSLHLAVIVFKAFIKAVLSNDTAMFFCCPRVKDHSGL
jgi:hypothetical protein